jgi:flagellar hook-length control protein FliK
MSSVILLLQAQPSSNSTESLKQSENQGVEPDSPDLTFGNMLSEAEKDIQIKSGKGLPKEEEMPRSHNSVSRSDPEVLNLIQRLSIREAGQINLIGADVSVEDSNHTTPELREERVATEVGESSIVMMDVEWLKLRGDISLKTTSQQVANEVNVGKPTNLAESLASQITEGSKSSNKTFRLVELIASSAAVGKISKSEDYVESKPLEIRMADLLPGIKSSNSSRQSASDQNLSQSSSSPYQSDLSSSDMKATGEESKDFRQFLAEHLRKSDSMKEMSDRLGNMIARQIAAQIGRGRWSLEIAMHPAELGSIEVEMEMTERGLEASFRASHSATRDLLMESMPRLKSWFEEGGIDVAYAGLTQDSGAQNGGNSTGEQNTQSEVQATESEESSDLTDDQLFSDGSTGLDIRV